MSASRARAAAALMALSGASALVYETVWMRQLTRAFGVTVYAVAGLVALYMAGLALGAALAARAKGKRDWLRAYAWLELGAGAAALAASAWLARLPGVVAALSGDAPLSAAGRLLLAAPALLPPTLLLGATLPVLARDGGDGALLYGVNTLGALAGLAAAAFVTIGLWGEWATIEFACALNLLAAAGAFALSRKKAPRAAQSARAGMTDPRAVTLFLISGFCALGCEVLWSRQLIPLLGSSTYAFALILGFYLAGLGIGSCLRPTAPSGPWAAFSSLMGALGASIALSAAATRFIGLRLDSPDFLYSPLRGFPDFALVAMQAAILVAPTALILGLLFPAALRLTGEDGAAVGRLYAWNTLGGIAGSLACGFVGIATLGANTSVLCLAALALAGSLLAAAAAKKRDAWVACAVFALVSSCLGFYARRDPALEIIFNRLAAAGQTDARALFFDESPAASIAGVARGTELRLYINGIEVSDKGIVGELMALLPNLAVAEPRSALVVCFGVGSTFRAASLLGTPVDAVELVGDVVRRMPFFHEDAARHLEKPGNRVFIEDGRGFLLRSRAAYDTIVVDAAPPLYSAGAVNLYTREFFELVLAHLNDQGAFLLWLPTLSFEEDYWGILRSFCAVFPHAAIWRAPGWSGFMVLGSRRPLEWPKGTLRRRIDARAHKAFPWKGLTEENLRKRFSVPEADLRAFISRYEPITDDHPSVEFPFWRFWRGRRLMASTDFIEEARGAARP